MELRRHKDIIAFKDGAQAPIAFHARNLEVAELSDEAWNAMALTSLESSLPVFSSSKNEANESLENWNREMNSEVKSGAIEFGIRSLTLNITQICNLHCTYCAAGGDGSYGDALKRISVEKTLPQLRFFLEKVPAGEKFHITFLGGEPLLYPEAIELIFDYVQLMTAGKSIKSTFSIVTNGTLITENVLRILTKIKANVSISLDGPKEINDTTRPQKNGKGCTDDVVSGIEKLIQNKKNLGRLLISAVFTNENTEVVKAYNFFSQFDVDFFEFAFSVTGGEDSANRDYVAQLKEVAKLAYEKGGESELRRITIFDSYFAAIDNQQQIENYCGAGKSYLMIDARNQVFTCPWEVGSKEARVGADSALDMEKLSEFSKPLIERNNCQNCWARFLCGGGCMFAHKAKTGTKTGKDVNFCIRTRDLISTAVLYYKKSRITCE